MSSTPLPTPDDSPKLSRREWGLLAVLTAVSCTQITDTLLIVPLAQKLQDDVIRSADQSAELYSFVSSVYGFAAGVCGLIASAVVDKFDRKRYLLIVFGGLIASIAFTATATDFTTLLLARLLAGAFGGLTSCGVLAVLGDLIPERRRGAALGVLNAAFAFAAVIGMPAAFAATLASNFVWPSFVVVAAAGAGVWVLAWFRLPDVGEHKHRKRENPLRELTKVLSDRNHAVAFAFMLCVGLGAYCVIPFMAQYMQLNCGVPKGDFLVIFLVMGACSLPAVVAAGKLTDRFGRRGVFVAFVLLTVGMTLVVTNLPPVDSWVAGAVAAGYMAVAVARLVPTHAVMMSAARSEMRGAYTTVYNSVSVLSTSIGPLIAGQIVKVPKVDGVAVSVDNYPTAGLVAVAFSLAAVALVWVVRPAKQ